MANTIKNVNIKITIMYSIISPPFKRGWNNRRRSFTLILYNIHISYAIFKFMQSYKEKSGKFQNA